MILFSLRLPIFKKILIGISKSKNPTDILLDIIRVLERGIEKNKKNMKPRKEENRTNAEEERTKEEEVYEPSASGESDRNYRKIPKKFILSSKLLDPKNGSNWSESRIVFVRTHVVRQVFCLRDGMKI